jgi:hypothetical protein
MGVVQKTLNTQNVLFRLWGAYHLKDGTTGVSSPSNRLAWKNRTKFESKNRFKSRSVRSGAVIVYCHQARFNGD